MPKKDNYQLWKFRIVHAALPVIAFILLYGCAIHASETESEPDGDTYLSMVDLAADQALTTTIASTVYIVEDESFFNVRATMGRGASARFAPRQVPGALDKNLHFLVNRGVLSSHIIPEQEGATRTLLFASQLGFVKCNTGTQHDFIMDARIDGALVITSLLGSLEYGYADEPEKPRVLEQGQQIILYPRKNVPEPRPLDPVELDKLTAEMIGRIDSVEQNNPEATVTISMSATLVVAGGADDASADDSAAWAYSESTSSKEPVVSTDDTYDLMDFVVEYQGSQEGPRLTQLQVGPVDVLSSGWGRRFILQSQELEDNSQLTIHGTFADAAGIRKIEVSVDDGAFWSQAAGMSSFDFSFVPELSVSYPIHIRVTMLSGDSFEYYIGIISWKQYERPSVESITIGPREFTYATINSDSLALFTKEDTVRSQLKIIGVYGTQREHIQDVWITLDAGATWDRAEGSADFEYAFRPDPDVLYTVGIRAVMPGDMIFEEDFFWQLSFKYTEKTLTESLEEVVEAQFEAYRAEDFYEIMRYVSETFNSPESNIADYYLLQNAIRNDFAHPDAMYQPSQLQYQIQSVETTPGQGAGSVAVSWKNRLSDSYQTVLLNYVQSGGQWVLQQIDGPSPFGVYVQMNQPAEIELSVSPMSVTATESALVKINVRILNGLGDPLPGVTAQFHISSVTAGVLSADSGVSDDQGLIPAVFVPSVSIQGREEVQIFVQVGLLSASAAIEVLADSPPPPDFPH